MRSNKRSILTPVDPVLIPDVKSYWATHFYSVLKCIDSHKNLMYSPRRFNEYPVWTLGLLRGNLPFNFFEYIENYLKNWGAQYFFASFFNQKLGGHIIIELLERLEDLYGVCFSKNLDTFSFYVSGNDSFLSDKLSNRFTEVFPFKDIDDAVNNLIAYSDLCLIVENSFDGSSVAIFGEVEGSYGNKFKTESYWEKKQEFCVFGIGVVDGNQKQVYFEESHHNGIDRVHLLFEKSHFLIRDFLKVLDCFRWLLMNGPNRAYPSTDEEFDFFSDYMRANWGTPIEQIFQFLEKFIDGGELVGYNSGSIQIITDLQAT